MTTLTEQPRSMGHEAPSTTDHIDRTEMIVPLGMIARFVAPQRFDVHQVSAFESWLYDAAAAGAPACVVDLSAVVFIDLAAVESIEAARARHTLDLADPSVAVSITYELLASGRGTTALLQAA